nr:hypothetical protein [Tanacetum cinerariifolium]
LKKWVKYQLILKTYPFSLNPRRSTNPEGSRGRKLRPIKQLKLRNKKRVKKLEGKKKKRTHGLKRLYKVGLTARVESSKEEEGLSDHKDASKQGRGYGENIEQDATVAKKEVSAATDKVVTTAESVDGIIVATTSQISKDDMKAKIEEEDRIVKEKDEANRAVIEEWDDVQATIDVDRQLAEQLQA